MILNLTEKIWLCIVIAAVVFVPIIICAIRRRKRLARHRLERNCYSIYMSPVYCIVGIMGICMFLGFAVTTIFEMDTDMIAVSIFLFCVFFFEFCCCFILAYEVRCDADSLTIYQPPLPRKRIMLYEITRVRYVENRRGFLAGGQMHLYLYQGEKKLLDVDQNMIGFYRLLEQLAPEKRMERAFFKESGLESGEIRDDFIVTETTAEKARAIFFLVFFGGICAVILWNWEEMISEGVADSVFYLSCFLVITVISLKNFMRKMLRKITVSYRTISIRNALGKTVSYSMGEITQVLEKKHDMEIYVKGKMIVRVSKDDKNYALLAERFLKEGLMASEDTVL